MKTPYLLNEVAVGDFVIIRDGHSGTQRVRVVKVGRKYITVGVHQFERETGRWSNPNFASQKHAYTEAAWARRLEESKFAGYLARLRDGRTAVLSDADLAAANEWLSALADRLSK